MKTNKEIAKEIAEHPYDGWDGGEAFNAAMQMAEAKDRQFAEIVKAKADEMYAKSQGVRGQFYGDREDAMVIYDYLSDFYTEITGEYL